MNIISLGAGVQSTTLLLMAAHGEIEPKPDYAVFSDTGWEPKAVYDHLDWLEKEVAKYGIKVIRTNNGNIREDILEATRSGKRFASIPFFIKSKKVITHVADIDVDSETNEILVDPETGEIKETLVELETPQIIDQMGMVRRQCTREYKITPVEKKIRELMGYKPRQRIKEKAILWMGISTDEIQRVRTNQTKWIENRYPLIEKWMNRMDCMAWLEKKGYPVPPKSSCIGCPFHDNHMWRDMKMNDPESWNDAVEIDREIKKLPRFKGEAFLHSSCKPLDEVYLQEDQMELDFGSECTGYCGV